MSKYSRARDGTRCCSVAAGGDGDNPEADDVCGPRTGGRAEAAERKVETRRPSEDLRPDGQREVVGGRQPTSAPRAQPAVQELPGQRL